MNLITNIKARSTGTVTVRDGAGKPYEFKPDEAGVLVCEVEDPALVGRLLALGDFEPANEADHAEAEKLLKAASGDDDGDADNDGDFDGDPDSVPAGALPEEANTTPVASARPRRQRAAR